MSTQWEKEFQNEAEVLYSREQESTMNSGWESSAESTQDDADPTWTEDMEEDTDDDHEQCSSDEEESEDSGGARYLHYL